MTSEPTKILKQTDLKKVAGGNPDKYWAQLFDGRKNNSQPTPIKPKGPRFNYGNG